MTVISPESVPKRWNHNIHYHGLLLRQLSGRAGQVLDVGCGDGMLVRKLAARCDRVIGIDVDQASIVEARRLTTSANVSFLQGDILTHPFEDESFDAIFSVAALHHFDTEAGLRRMSALLKPGGVLAVIGLGRPQIWPDRPWLACGLIASQVFRLWRPFWEHPSPKVWPPPQTERQVEAIAQSVLPGCQFRSRLLWRYSLFWTKPCGNESAKSNA